MSPSGGGRVRVGLGAFVGVLLAWWMALPATLGDAGPWTGPGALDASYPAGTGPDGPVWAAIAFPDGSLLVGGAFRHVDGVAAPGVARLKPNGALDTSFSAAVPAGVGSVSELARQGDGRVLVGGDQVVRLNEDGTLDAGYRMVPLTALRGSKGFPDGRMMVWVTFGSGDLVKRLTVDGSEDGSFSLPSLRRKISIGHIEFDFEGRVRSLVGRPGGGYHVLGDWNYSPVAVTGNVLTVDDQGRPIWGRRDEAAAEGEIAVGEDGRLVVAPASLGTGMYRLTPDGTLDPTFRTETQFEREGADGLMSDRTVSRMTVQKNGKVLVAGALTRVNGKARYHLARLNEVGALDETFDAGSGVSGPYWPLAMDSIPGERRLFRINQIVPTPDDGLVIVGSFTGVQGVARPYLARLRGGELRQAPSILAPPASLTRIVGESARFDGVFSSFEPPTYRWFHGEQPVVHGTNAVLTLGSVSLADAGEYWVEVSNSVGSTRSDRARLEVVAWTVPQVTLTPTNAHVAAGSNVVLTATAAGVPAPTLQWRREGVDLPGATNSTLDLVNLAPARAGRYQVVARSSGGEAVSQDAWIEVDALPRPVPGGLDLSLYVELRELYPEPVMAMALDGERRLVFTQAAKNLRRLSADGTLDLSFNPGQGPALAPGTIPGYCSELGKYGMIPGARTLATQADGKILVGGIFAQFDGRPAGAMVRLQEEGAIDNEFQVVPGATGGGWSEVSVFHPLPDGRVLASGTFEAVNGRPAGRLTRLLPDGTVDPQFNPRGAISLIPFSMCGSIQNPIRDQTAVRSLAVQSDGRIVVGGTFETYDGVTVPGLCRLEMNGDGAVGFPLPNATGGIMAMTVGPGNTVLAAVGVYEIGLPKARVLRWRVDGQLDTSFQSPEFVRLLNQAAFTYSSLTSLQVDDRGRVYVGGGFTVGAGDQERRHVVRLNSDGSLDTTWGAPGKGPDGEVRCLLLEPTGDLLIGGFFATVDGVPRQSLARLYGDRVAGDGAPRITAVARRGGNLEVTVTTVAGHAYRLERRRGLAADSGWEAQAEVIAGDGSAIVLSVPVVAESAVFWRVRRD